VTLANAHEAVKIDVHEEGIAMIHHGYSKTAAAAMLSAALFCGIRAYADETPAPSKHQLMKDCMAKQKASDSGRLKEDMEKSCRDLSKTEKQNADRAIAAQGTSNATQDATPHN
jgi:hypothetical protein